MPPNQDPIQYGVHSNKISSKTSSYLETVVRNIVLFLTTFDYPILSTIKKQNTALPLLLKMFTLFFKVLYKLFFIKIIFHTKYK